MIPRIRLSEQGPEFSRLVYGTWRLLADADGAIEHVMCRARGDRHCQWRAEWRRR